MEEILAHVSAPATRTNGDLYFSLVVAYLDFIPVTSSSSRTQVNVNDKKKSQTMASISLEDQNEDLGHMFVSNTSNESYGSFPSHVSSESLQRHVNISAAKCSFSSVCDPLDDKRRFGGLEQIQTSRRIQERPRVAVIKDLRSISRPMLDSVDIPSFIEDTQLAAQAIESKIFNKLSTTSEDTSEDGSWPRTSGYNAPQSQHRTELIGRLPREHSFFESVPITPLDRLVLRIPSSQTLAIASTHGSQERSRNFDNPREPPDFSKLPYEAFPPAPKVSIESPGSLPSQLTNYLATIRAQNPDLYMPSSQ
ncbi:hypothetical protein CC78DRAFT_611476 [Lojkania enalia]|uniref:Uncharacterized protein n=1 Tax=Lojkania enalia TaxID=147567 RepID=A0A9P4NCI6_9PLEO|nr:hypothetical protein CC78DRAFT_611476 [Didymosphaeria enalia]